jgi:hypothetical protein
MTDAGATIPGQRANAGDVEGLVALYESEAVLAVSPERLATGHQPARLS